MANAIEQIVVHHDHGSESEIRNLPQASANGMPVTYEQHNLKQDIMTVAPGSTSFLSIDPSTSQISISSLAITTVHVNSTATTISDFVSSDYIVGNEFQEGDLIVLALATDAQHKNWIHNGGSAGDTSDFTRLQSDLVAADVRSFFDAAGVLRFDGGTGTYSVDFGNAGNQLGAHAIPVDSSIFSTINQSEVSGALVALEDLIESNDTAQTNLVNALAVRMDMIVGNGLLATSLGTFTGDNKPDINSSIKEAIQKLVDVLDTQEDKDSLLDTVLGVDSDDADMGSYTDTICPNNASIKAVTQAIGTALQNEIANRTSDVNAINTAISTNDGNANTAINLRTQMSVSTISLTANTSLQVAHGFTSGFMAQVEDANGKIVNPEIVKTGSNVTITSEVDLSNCKLTLIGY